jgi:hypothetical protein
MTPRRDDDLEPQLAAALAAVDVDAVRAEYRRQNEFFYREGFLPPALVERFVREVEAVRPAIHRNYIPRHKKGGSVSAFTLAAQAPALTALYRSPSFLRFVEAVTGRRLQHCPATDPHAWALYFYTEPGDHIGYHFDTSYYVGERFTILVGLVERSTSRLLAQPYKRLPDHAPVEVSLATTPGTLVLFHGDKLWHAITPLGEDEERVSLTLEYVTDPGMTPFKRFISNMKDSVAYFGFRSVFGGTSR